MKKIVLTGGTGFVGQYLADKLIQNNFSVTIISRSKHNVKKQGVTFSTYEHLDDEINGSYGIINLAGQNLFDQRWTPEIKSQILESRVQITKQVVQAINNVDEKPTVLISASAVGYYGNRDYEFLREDSHPGTDFLADVCKKWEEEALKASCRVVIPRIGIVLEKNGGALGKMLLPFKLFVGGPLGSGNQYFPWVHMDDVVDSILFALQSSDFSGTYNCVAPQPVTMNQFATVLGNVLNRPSLFSVPEFALKFVVGEASEALVASQHVIPEVLLKNGYKFRFDDLAQALISIL